MSTIAHERRLARLEAASGATNRERLVFALDEWTEEGFVRQGVNDDDETIGRMRAEALDRLVAAGRIENDDRDRVQFVVRVLARPSRPEQLEPY